MCRVPKRAGSQPSVTESTRCPVAAGCPSPASAQRSTPVSVALRHAHLLPPWACCYRLGHGGAQTNIDTPDRGCAVNRMVLLVAFCKNTHLPGVALRDRQLGHPIGFRRGAAPLDRIHKHLKLRSANGLLCCTIGHDKFYPRRTPGQSEHPQNRQHESRQHEDNILHNARMLVQRRAVKIFAFNCSVNIRHYPAQAHRVSARHAFGHRNLLPPTQPL